MIRRDTVISLAVAAWLLLAAQGAAFDKVRIVFYHVQGGEGIATTAEEYLKQVISESLAVSAIVEPVSISNIYVIFDSLGIPPESCTKTECAIKIGKYTSAKKSMYVQLRKDLGGQLMLSTILFDIETNAIEYTSSPFFLMLQDTNSVIMAVKQLVGVIESRIPVIPEIVQVNPGGGSAVIDCGSVHGIRKDVWYDIIAKIKRGVKYDEVKVGEARIESVTRENAKVQIRKIQGKTIRSGSQLRIIKGEDHQAPEMLHEPFNLCAANMPLTVTLDLSDPSGIGWATMIYMTNVDTAQKKLTMNPEQGNRYSAIIPAEDIRGGELAYWFEASDLLNNTGVYRALGGAMDFTATIKSDDHEDPTLDHRPIQLINRGMLWNPTVKAHDNTMVDAVRVIFRFKGEGAWKQRKMIQYGAEAYGLEVAIPDTLNETILDYYLKATDIAGNNAQLGSETKPYSVLVGTNDTEKPQLVIDQADWSDSTRTILISADARDNNKVKSVVLSYYHEGLVVKDIELDFAEGETWQKRIVFPDSNIKSLQYRLQIADLMNNLYESSVRTTLRPSTIRQITDDHEKPKLLTEHQRPITCFLADSGKVMQVRSSPHSKHLNGTYYINFMIADNVDITHMMLFYRSIGDYDYAAVPIFVWNRELYGIFIQATAWGLEYFAEAYDPNNNILKIGSASEPLRVRNPQLAVTSNLMRRVISRVKEHY